MRTSADSVRPVSDQYGEIINERPWVQFNLHKYADQIVYAEPGEEQDGGSFRVQWDGHLLCGAVK